MKVHTIEIAKAIEQELQGFLKDWGGGFPMKFTRFIDLGGRQTDLYIYTAEEGASPWMIVRIKSVMKSEQGECIQVFVIIAGKEKRMEETLVSPEVWKLPALADRVLKFAKNDMLVKISEAGNALGNGDDGGNDYGSSSNSSSSDDDDEDYDDLDTAGILAGGGSSGGGSDFNPDDIIAQANAGGGDDLDPSDLIAQMNAQSDGDDEEEDIDPSEMIRRMNEESEDDKA